MKKLAMFSIILLLSCTTSRIEKVVSPQGQILKLNSTSLVIPANSLKESTRITMAKKTIARKSFEEGYKIVGDAIVIGPETLLLENPATIYFPMKAKNGKLGSKIGNGLVPLAESRVEGETLRAKITHGGEYYIIETPEHYGILNHSKTKEALLVVGDIYVGDYLKKFRKTMSAGGYNFPIWTFIYSAEKSIEENAKFLAEELKKLHELYGDFRLDVVGFGIGGLITHHYAADAALYQHDISSAIIAVGTPFKGSNFAVLDNIRKGKSPYRFFFIDALGKNVMELSPESDLITWILHSRLTGAYFDNIEENKNFASIRSSKIFTGVLPEELQGDGLVSLNSTLLTPIEPEPFAADHFELYEDMSVHDVVNSFIQLYRTFNWPLIFDRVWKNEEKFTKISEIWEKEVKLNFRKSIDFEVLVEFNENMLKSAPTNAILITNGDNDTYPAWYLQEKGVRKDVLIVNRSLLNLTKNALFLKKHGLPLDITDEQLEKLKPHKTKSGDIFLPSDYLIKLLLKQKQRPVAISTTVSSPERWGYPLRLTGLIYEIGSSDSKIDSDEGEIYIDIERTKELLHSILDFKKCRSTPVDSLSIHLQNLAKNYSAIAFSLSNALSNKEKFQEALDELEMAKSFSNSPTFNYTEGEIYLKLNKKESAVKIFKELLTTSNLNVKLKKNIASAYYNADMKTEAIKVLAECLKTNPEDKELIDLIKKYQED